MPRLRRAGWSAPANRGAFAGVCPDVRVRSPMLVSSQSHRGVEPLPKHKHGRAGYGGVYDDGWAGRNRPRPRHSRRAQTMAFQLTSPAFVTMPRSRGGTPAPARTSRPRSNGTSRRRAPAASHCCATTRMRRAAASVTGRSSTSLRTGAGFQRACAPSPRLRRGCARPSTTSAGSAMPVPARRGATAPTTTTSG